jgi:hypothetical protein
MKKLLQKVFGRTETPEKLRQESIAKIMELGVSQAVAEVVAPPPDATPDTVRHSIQGLPTEQLDELHGFLHMALAHPATSPDSKMILLVMHSLVKEDEQRRKPTPDMSPGAILH